MKKFLLIASVLLVGSLIMGQGDSFSSEEAILHQNGGAVSGINEPVSSYDDFSKNAAGETKGSPQTSEQKRHSESYKDASSYKTAEGLQPVSTCVSVESDLPTCSAVK